VSRLLTVAVVLCLLYSMAMGSSPVEQFVREMEEDIATGNVRVGGGEFVPERAGGIKLRPEGVQGYTYWLADDSLAPFTWVRAVSEYGQHNAWTHTTWTIYNDYYVHGRTQPWEIPWGHKWYIKGLHWVPANTPDYPSKKTLPSPPPGWAVGHLNSPVYFTNEVYGHPDNGHELQIILHVGFSENAVIWQSEY